MTSICETGILLRFSFVRKSRKKRKLKKAASMMLKTRDIGEPCTRYKREKVKIKCAKIIKIERRGIKTIGKTAAERIS